MNGGTIDAGACIDNSPWTGYQKWLTALTAIAVTFDGFDIQILGFAIPSLVKDFGLQRSDFAPVLAIGLVGMALGAPLAGYVGDRFGRRPALIVCVAVFAFATLASAFANELFALAVLRFITGLGAGGAVPNAGALVAEFAPWKRRPLAVKLTIVCVPLGGMLGGFLAAWILPTMGWRAMYIFGGALPLAFALILWAALPESPRFLVRQPRLWPKLRDLLRRMGHSVPEGTAFTDRAESTGAQHISLGAVFGSGLARDTSGLLIAFFFCLGSIFLVFSWLPALLSEQGLGVASSSNGLAVYNFGGVAGVLLWSLLCMMFGSRVPMIGGALGCSLSAIALLWVPIRGVEDTTLLLVALGVLGLLANAVQTSMYALAAHVYPAAIRSTGVAYCATAGRVGGIVASLSGAAVIHSGLTAYWSAIAIAMLVSSFGLILVRRHFPPAR